MVIHGQVSWIGFIESHSFLTTSTVATRTMEGLASKGVTLQQSSRQTQMNPFCLVGGFNPSEKYESQLG